METEYIYFTFINNTIKLSFKDYIKDIINDNSNHIIPFSNGCLYKVYQEMTFELADLFEKNHENYSINISENNDIIINNLEQTDNIIELIKKTIHDIINKKFNLI